MKISPHQYARAYLAAASDSSPAKREIIAKNFWQLVWRRGHMKWSKTILSNVKTLLNEQHGVQSAQVITPQALSDSQKSHLANQLSKAVGKQMQLEYQIKPHLLAGMIVTINDQRFDASLKGRVDSLYSALAHDNN